MESEEELPDGGGQEVFDEKTETTEDESGGATDSAEFDEEQEGPYTTDDESFYTDLDDVGSDLEEGAVDDIKPIVKQQRRQHIRVVGGREPAGVTAGQQEQIAGAEPAMSSWAKKYQHIRPLGYPAIGPITEKQAETDAMVQELLDLMRS